MIRLSSKDKFLVVSESSHVYVVDLSIPACSCPSYIMLQESGKGGECKHIKEARARLKRGEVIEKADLTALLYLLRKSVKKA